MFVGVDGDLHPVPQPELGEDAGDVALHGRLAEVEAAGDLGVDWPWPLAAPRRVPAR
jgi:hypothetical protein